MPKSFVAMIAYTSKEKRQAAHDAAYANHESLSQMIGRLLDAEIKRLEAKQRRAQAQKTEQAK